MKRLPADLSSENFGIDDAIVVLENVCGNCLAWESEMWFA